MSLTPDAELQELSRDVAQIFSAMGDPNRAQILLLLVQGERFVSELAQALEISESAISQHLRHLRHLRLVRSRKAGRYVYYSLDDEHVRRLLEVCVEHTRDG